MRTAVWWLSVCLLSCVVTRPANAYFDTGNALLAFCESRSIYEQGHCLGSIIGYYEMMTLGEGYDCGSDVQRSKKQMQDVVVKYLKDNPAKRSDPAATLSFLAFFSAFNCKAPPPQ
jgi:hypothetical protein